MTLPTWIPDALHSEQRYIEKTYWRCVEAQHIVSTLQLVDTPDEQHLLEEILEETKPSVPAECIGLHYLYITPFRYGVYLTGSSFRKAGPTPGVFYVSEEPSDAIMETAFHLQLFNVDSPDTPIPFQPSEHLVFDVPIKTSCGMDLTARTFSDVRCL